MYETEKPKKLQKIAENKQYEPKETDINNVCKDLPVYKRIGDIEVRKEEFPKTTTNKIKR